MELIHVEKNQTGPDGEFRFWKCQMTRMNSLVQELSRPDIKNVISVLEQAKSNIIPVGFGAEVEFDVSLPLAMKYNYTALPF